MILKCLWLVEIRFVCPLLMVVWGLETLLFLIRLCWESECGGLGWRNRNFGDMFWWPNMG